MNRMPAGEAEGSKGKENHFLGSGPLTPFPIAGTVTCACAERCAATRQRPTQCGRLGRKPAQDRHSCLCQDTPGADLAKGGIGSNKRCIFQNIELSQAEKLQHLMGR
jgi:hypothetical protein